MGYEDSVYGKLNFSRPEVAKVAVPDELREQAEKYGLTLVEDANNPVNLSGLSSTAQELMRADKTINWFFNISAEDADADDSDSGRTEDLERAVQRLIKIANDDNVTVNGIIEVLGASSNTDIWRLVVTENKLINEKAIISWPDGSPVRH